MLTAVFLACLSSVSPLDGPAKPPEPIASPAGLIHPRRLLVQVRPGAGAAEVDRAHARCGGQVLRDLPQIGWQVIEVDPRRLVAVRESYLSEPLFLRADFDRAKKLAHVPNDPYWPMWHMQRIRADVAWDTLKGSPGVRVAIMDTGLSWQHPDLIANV